MVIRVGDTLRTNTAGRDEIKYVERVIKASFENMYKVHDTDDESVVSHIYDKDIKDVMVNGNWVAYSPQKKKPFII